MIDLPAAWTQTHSYFFFLSLLCSPPLGNCWNLQSACPRVFLLSSSKIVLQLLFEPLLKFFYYETKNPKRGTPISLVPSGTPKGTPGLDPPHSFSRNLLLFLWLSLWMNFGFVWLSKRNVSRLWRGLPPLWEQNTNDQMFRVVNAHMKSLWHAC